jgi:hypothetical protein
LPGGEQVLGIANSQLGAFRKGDTPSQPLEPPRILRTPL